jgi:hypothetical protein
MEHFNLKFPNEHKMHKMLANPPFINYFTMRIVLAITGSSHIKQYRYLYAKNNFILVPVPSTDSTAAETVLYSANLGSPFY